jgi:C-methyltransferase-like protein/methyltransferase family protein/putative zinc binding protein
MGSFSAGDRKLVAQLHRRHIAVGAVMRRSILTGLHRGSYIAAKQNLTARDARIMERFVRAQRDNPVPAAVRRCLLCQEARVQPLVEFGPQPPSNRFEFKASPETERHPLTIGQCGGCGLVQLISPMSPDMVKARFEWLVYNEPESHLDDLVERVNKLPGVEAGKRIFGLTYKDDTTLARFDRAGYQNTDRCNPALDLGINDRCAGLETIQGALAGAAVSELVAKHGLADVLICRHILEHAHDPILFLTTVGKLMAPAGFLVIEVPDCAKFVGACDYSFVWEEHITYFSSETLAAVIDRAGLTLHEIFAYPYPYEDALIAIVRSVAPDRTKPREPQDIRSLLKAGEKFSETYEDFKARIQSRLRSWRQKGKRIAVFGAGHLAAKFINFYALADLIECVIDDHENKREMLMPGSRVPIRGGAALKDIDICLLSLNPESERKVVAKHQSFCDSGGQFMSIFSLNPNSVYRDPVK